MAAKKDQPPAEPVGKVAASVPDSAPVVGRIVDAPDKPDASSVAQVQELDS